MPYPLFCVVLFVCSRAQPPQNDGVASDAGGEDDDFGDEVRSDDEEEVGLDQTNEGGGTLHQVGFRQPVLEQEACSLLCQRLVFRSDAVSGNIDASISCKVGLFLVNLNLNGEKRSLRCHATSELGPTIARQRCVLRGFHVSGTELLTEERDDMV